MARDILQLVLLHLVIHHVMAHQLATTVDLFQFIKETVVIQTVQELA